MALRTLIDSEAIFCPAALLSADFESFLDQSLLSADFDSFFDQSLSPKDLMSIFPERAAISDSSLKEG